MDRIAEICEFWLGDSVKAPERAFDRLDWWYRGGPDVDAEIDTRFGDLVALACDGGLPEWETTGRGAFALILLLDQFTRNTFRNTPNAYLGDPRAYAVVNEAIRNGLDRDLHPVERIWLYHPFHHAESVEDQDRGLQLLGTLLDETERAAAPGKPAWSGWVQRSIDGWTRHRNIVAEFGRFPHRNAVLGRASTDAEEAFLAAGAESFGQGVRTGDTK